MKYRVSNVLDPEERLEDAAMAKAMYDASGGVIEIVDDGEADFGRGKWFAKPRKNIAYWDDPAFLESCNRQFGLFDFRGAETEVARLHSDGKGAFVKATDLKLFTSPVPLSVSFDDAIGNMAYSFIDRSPCLMVQELCKVEWEFRFVSINRQIVTYSAVAAHLVPTTPVRIGYGYQSPASQEPEYIPAVVTSLLSLAKSVAMDAREENVIIDCALFNDQPSVIEFNPFSIGNFGLYACNPHAIATAYFASNPTSPPTDTAGCV